MKLRIPQANLSSRLKAATIHLSISVLAACLAAALVFGVWYRWPYRLISGGQDLFILLTSVDIVLGPLLTFSVFDVVKKKAHLRRDLVVIALLQLAALVYGLKTVYDVRPVAMVFEVDRFRVITPIDVHRPELPSAPAAYRELPLTGPWLLGTRRPRSSEENTDALVKGLAGIDIGQRPLFWQPYEQSKSDALKKARPISALLRQYPDQRAEVVEALARVGLKMDDAKFLPVMARLEWVAVLNSEGNLATYLPLSGFF